MADLLVKAVAAAPRDAVRIAAASAWLDDLAGLDAEAARARLQAGFQPTGLLPAHAGARSVLALAALEALQGSGFHGFSVGRLLQKSEDDVEDLLHDDEFELDGKPVGTCSAAVPSEAMTWTSLPDGLHPVFQFSDARLPVALVSARRPTRPRCRIAAAGYGPAAVWQIADRIWRLDVASDRPRQVQQLLVGTERPRIEMGFRRMPVIQSQQPCRWPSPGSQDGDGVRGRGRGSGSAGGGSGVPGGGRGGPAPEAARARGGGAGAARRGAAGAGDAPAGRGGPGGGRDAAAGGRPHREPGPAAHPARKPASWKGI
ncbi:MAG: hypothetical protein R3F60_30975 [bacterium]